METFAKQDYHYNTKELFEPITKTAEKTGEKFREESKDETAANESFVLKKFSWI